MAEGLITTARAVSEAALSTEGVHALGGGTFAEAATYGLGGEKFVGVVVDDERVEIHIVANYPLAKPIPELAKEVEKGAAPRSGGRRITVVVEDIEVGDDVDL